MTNNDCTILVCTCDAYRDVWPPFFTLLHRYWPDCALPILLNTETATYTEAGLDIRCAQLYTGKKTPPYGRRMLDHLALIDTPFTLVLLDDFFIRRPVDTNALKQLLTWMRADENIACFDFDSVAQGTPAAQYDGWQQLPPLTPFALNMQAALWRTQELRRAWKPQETPWQWETYGNIRTRNTQKQFYYLCPGAQSPIDYGKQPGMNWGVVRGKWYLPDVQPLFEKEGIAVDYAQRGTLTQEPQIQRQTGLRARWRESCELLYSAGAWFWLCNLCHVVKSRLLHAACGKPIQSYENYLTHKNK